MGNELGNKTDVDLLLVSFVTSTPIFILIGNNDFVNEYSEKKLALSSRRGYFGEIESEFRT